MNDASKTSHETIFVEALARPPGEREAFVDRACADDLAKAAHVKELLRGYEENSGFLESPPAGADSPSGAGPACPEPGRRAEAGPGSGVADPGTGLNEAGHSGHPHEPVPGDRIGHYKLLERIGEGACGIVYMAEQEQPVRRRVALKLIKLGLDTRDFIARFEAERQALALMDHPNIARVFDAGATDRGRPYFVMELVRGIPITRFCDENKLPPATRLELFIQVCHAIQHAHQKGIIHRDIKPSNILVAVNDGVPVPKVIDFGIAKATQGRLTDKTLFTRFHAFIGTPAYSSPEQAEVTNLDVDTRSDIYSLGVLLYELLTGHQPIDPATIERLGFEEMRRVIRDVEPPRPSARVSSLGHEERTSVAQRRAVDTGKLALLLRSDLDWIVMRCLEKDRRRRYETAAALAQDVGRYLDNEPIVARPPSAAYRLQKLIRRHQTAFFAVTSIAVVVVAGLIVSSALFLRERAARSRAVAAERVEGELRREAEDGRVLEIKRSSRAALNLARQLLAEGKTADGLAYLVHAARRDPTNTAIAPRLASLLTSRNFLVPERSAFSCGARVLAMRYTNDGRSLLVGTEDGTLRIFDPATGQLTREVRLGHAVKRNGWVFARDDDRVCAVRFVGDTLGVLDIASGRLLFPPLTLDSRVLPGEGVDPAWGDAGSVALSPDGRWLFAYGLLDYWLWDASNGELRIQRSLPGYHFQAFSPDGSRFAQVTGDAVTVWSLPDARLVAGPFSIERHVARPGHYLIPLFSGDGRQLVVVDPYEAIHVFDAADGTPLHSWPHVDWIDPGHLQILPDGRLFADCAGATELWDPDSGLSGKLPFPGWNQLRVCASDRLGARLLLTTSAGLGLLVSTATGELLAEETSLHESGDMVAALSPDGGQIAVGTGSGDLRWLRAGRGAARPLEIPAIAAAFTRDAPTRIRCVDSDRMRLIDVASGRAIAGSVPNPAPLSFSRHLPDFSPGARFLVLRPQENPWDAWDYGSGAPRVVRLAGGSSFPLSDFDPDGNFLARLGRDFREAGVWDLSTGALAGPMVSYENDQIVASAFELGPAGARLATGHSRGAVAVWETATGQLVTTLAQATRARPSGIYFNPDGRRLVVSTGWGEARVWDAQTGKPLSPPIEIPTGGQDNITAGAVFSPDGRWIATNGSRGVTVRDATTFAPAGAIMPSEGLSGSGSFSRDGTRLVADANLRVWEAPGGDQVTEGTHESGAPGGVRNIQLSPDGRYLSYQTQPPSDVVVRIRSIPPHMPDGESIPEWLLQLASVLAGRTVNDAEECVSDPTAMRQIDAVRRELATLSVDAPYADWGRWILDDRADRPIAPGFTITPAEADKMAATSEP